MGIFFPQKPPPFAARRAGPFFLFSLSSSPGRFSGSFISSSSPFFSSFKASRAPFPFLPSLCCVVRPALTPSLVVPFPLFPLFSFDGHGKSAFFPSFIPPLPFHFLPFPLLMHKSGPPSLLSYAPIFSPFSPPLLRIAESSLFPCTSKVGALPPPFFPGVINAC